jgi:hypothetical protein
MDPVRRRHRNPVLEQPAGRQPLRVGCYQRIRHTSTPASPKPRARSAAPASQRSLTAGDSVASASSAPARVEHPSPSASIQCLNALSS